MPIAPISGNDNEFTVQSISDIQKVADRGVTVKVINKPPWRDLTTLFAKDILAFLLALAEDKRERII